LERKRRRAGRIASVPILIGWIALLAGCASIPGAGRSSDDLGAEIRPDAPPEYDVLVAQQHASEGHIPEAIAAYRRAVAKDEDSAYLHRLIADALARTNDLDGAIEHAERAYELEPDDAMGRNLLAQLYRVKRDPERARALLVDENGAPRDADSATTLYQIQLESEAYEDALATAQWMVDNDEVDPLRARIALANAYDKLGRPEESEQALRDALEVAPGDLRIYGALARSMRRRGDRDAEIGVYREVLEANPDDHATLVALADAQMAEDDLEGAIATLEEVEKRYPDDARSAVRLGFLLYEAQRFEEAESRFERALLSFPDEHEITFFLGVVRRRLGEEQKALAAFASIPEDHKHFAEARTQMAAIYEKRGDYEAARAEVARAMAVEPSRPLELYNAQLLAKEGDVEGAVAYLDGLLAQRPDDDEVIYNLGVVYGESGQTDQAIAMMQRALELNPSNASALNYIGYTLAERGEKLDEAEDMITRAIELRPEDGYIVDSLGWVYYMRARPLVESGRVEQAREWIERALTQLERAEELTGGDPVISEHLGDAYLLLNERKQALDKFQEAVELGPREGEQPDLMNKLEALQRELQ
jgi:tetratricopeptide (TPR) repeat protein